MWTSAFVLAHFLRFAENTLVTRRDLLNYGTQDAVDSALRRMIRSGFIKRLAWGVYVRPGTTEGFPSAESVAEAKIAAFQRTKVDSGLDTARQHEVVAQGEVEEVFEVDASTSGFNVFDEAGEFVHRVFLRRKVARKIQLDISVARKVIKALWSIGPERCTPQMLQIAVRNLDRDTRREFHLSHRWMPGWLSDMIHGFTTVRDRLAML